MEKADGVWLYRIQPNRLGMLAEGPTTEELAVVDEHFGYLKDLTENGVALFVGRTLNVDQSTFGIVVFRADSETAARALMNADPAVRRGLMSAELFPFKVVLRSSAG